MPNPSGPPTRSYQERYVAFLDILGFSSLVKKTVSDRTYFDVVINAFEPLKLQREFKMGEGIYRGYEDPVKSRFYMFSDCICHTVDPTPQGLIELIETVSGLCSSLIYTGVLVRGAIVLGRVYEEGQVIFGPGLIDAYENESKAAKYPRVLVTDDIYERSRSIEYVVGGRAPMRLEERIRRDFDGLYHVNWLCHFHRIYEPGAKGFRTDCPLDYGRIKEVVEYWLLESKERIDLQSKLRWFSGYFNEVLAKGKELNILGQYIALAPIDC